MRARRQDQEITPWQYWLDTHAALLHEVLRGNKGVTTFELREALYRNVKECTQFKPSLALSVYERLCGTRVLDFSAGWGDRLVAALACRRVERYLAFDPNTSLRDGHSRIIEAFGGDVTRRANFGVVYEPFESGTLPSGETFDLIFTSPPFFDFETYTSLPGQSAASYRGLDEWLVKFLFASLEKAWRVLDVGGHVAVHIVDVYKTQVCEAMNLFVQLRLPGAHYRGVIASRGGAGKPRPIWVWQKKAPSAVPSARVAQAGTYLKQYFPAVHQRLFN
jgi:hypothetical protein